MKEFFKKYAIDPQLPKMSEYYERAKAEYERCGDSIMDFESYPAFSELKEDIRRIREELLLDTDNVVYAYLLNSAIKARDSAAISALSCPKKNEESELYDTLPLFSLLYELSGMVALHRKRGVPRDVTEATIGMFENQVGDYISLYGRIGISAYVSWMIGFISCKMIRVGRFNLEICKYDRPFDVFSDGNELRIMPNGVTLHRSGQILGSVDCEDEEGAFFGGVTEDRDAYRGLSVSSGLVKNAEEVLDRSKWKRVLTKGDTVVSVHIPTGGAMPPETVEADLRRAEEIITKCFTDFSFFYCSSWLLDPGLEAITGKASNVTRFADRFLRFPMKSSGKDVYEYVFDTLSETDPDKLVPKSSFAKAIKEHLKSGGRVYGASGIMPKFSRQEKALIPMPLHLVIDDLGWFLGEDDRKNGGPSRSGMPRRHVAKDYAAINKLGEALDMRISCAFVIGEWDPDNRFLEIPHLSKYGDKWNNAAYLDREEMDRVLAVINSSPYIDLNIHGLLHGYYMDGVDDYDTSDYYYRINKELYMTNESEIKLRIGKFRELLDYYGIKKSTESFVPPSFAYRWGELSKVLSALGIKYISTIFSTMRCDGEKPACVGVENGIVTLDRNNNLIPWNECDCCFEDLPTAKGIFGAHWTNFLHPDPERNGEVVERAVGYFRRCAERYGIVLSRGIEFAAIQSLYHTYAKVSYEDGRMSIDLRSLSATPAKGKPFIISSTVAPLKVEGAKVRPYEQKTDFSSYELTPEGDTVRIYFE